MLRNFFAVALSALILAACTQSSAVEVARYGNEAINVRAEVVAGALDGVLKVYINEELVVNQRSQVFGGSSQTFNGTWRGRPVVARATLVQNLLSTYTQIDVFINGQLVETLVV